MRYEYKVVPSPTKGLKAKNAKTVEERFASAIEESLNGKAATGWEFLRAETLPSVERQGLTGSRTVFQTVLVFRRRAEAEPPAVTEDAPRLLEDRSPEPAPDDAAEQRPREPAEG